MGPQNIKNYPKIKSKSNVTIVETIGKIKFFNYMSTPKTLFEPYPDPKNSPLGLKKNKRYSKINSNSQVKNEGIIENECC